jgi:DNA-binding transcriptional LysR family regulator
VPALPPPLSTPSAAQDTVHAYSSLRLIRKLRLNQLLIIDSILQTLSFAATAQHLGMTQSAITKAVQELESFFDAKLFERTNRGVRPTALALRMGEHTGPILAGMHDMTESLNALRLGHAGHIVIATLGTASSQRLPDAIRAMRSRHPKIGVSIVVGDRAQLHGYLAEGKVDIVLGAVPSLPGNVPDAIAWHTLYEDALYVVAGDQHPMAHRTGLRLDALMGYPWILPSPESQVRARIDRLFADAALPLPDDVIESLSPISTLGLLSDQESLSFMSSGLAQLFLNAHMLTRIDVEDRWSFGDIGYAVRVAPPPSVATQTFIRHLRAQATHPYAT